MACYNKWWYNISPQEDLHGLHWWTPVVSRPFSGSAGILPRDQFSTCTYKMKGRTVPADVYRGVLMDAVPVEVEGQ